MPDTRHRSSARRRRWSTSSPTTSTPPAACWWCSGPRPLADNQLDVAVVDGRWVRVSARQGAAARPTRRSSATRSATASAPASRARSWSPSGPAPDGQHPGHRDRPGHGPGRAPPVPIPVLDNDFSPAGDQLYPGRPRRRRERPAQLDVQPAGDAEGRHRRRRSWPDASCATSPRRPRRRRDSFTSATSRPTTPGETAPGTSRSPSPGRPRQPAARAARARGPRGRGRHRQAAAARRRRRPRRRRGHPARHLLRARARPHRPLRRQLPAVPGLPGQRRHRRVRLHGHRLARGAADRHGPGGDRPARGRRSRRWPSPTPSPSSPAAPPRSTSWPTT